MEIVDMELKKAINYKLGNFSNQGELEEEDLKKIQDLSVSNREFSGELKNVNLEELRYLVNLRNLTLQYFDLDEEIIKMLNSFTELQTLQLASCKFSSKEVLQNASLKNIVLSCCDVRDYSLVSAAESTSIIGSDSVRLSKLRDKDKVKRLFLQGCKVKGIDSIIDFNSLESLNLDGSTVDDKNVIEDLKQKIPVSQEDEHLPIR